MKKILCFITTLLITTTAFAESFGLITVLATLSSTGLTAASVFTNNIAARSAQLARMREFIEQNGMYVASDAAGGGTEYLGSVADIAMVSDEKRDLFYKRMRKNYSVIFPTDELLPMYSAETILEISESL
ncbi:MAG: DUF3015 family protein [Spirochaetes bacterium]|jgi:hypothetical protein|nr:DUF3015 family protein [Spirochaetota bacterium]